MRNIVLPSPIDNELRQRRLLFSAYYQLNYIGRSLFFAAALQYIAPQLGLWPCSRYSPFVFLLKPPFF